MDFSKFDMRAKAETGQWLHLLHHETGVPIMAGKGKPCRVMVRGVASRSAQGQARERQKARMLALKGKKSDEQARVMEDIHNDLIDSAVPYVVGFENIERGERPLTSDPDDVRWLLDLTFPIMGPKEDEHGNTVTNAAGEPVFEFKNNPFAKQINEFASEQANALGNGSGS